jgi:hypothetical protein
MVEIMVVVMMVTFVLVSVIMILLRVVMMMVGSRRAEPTADKRPVHLFDRYVEGTHHLQDHHILWGQHAVVKEACWPMQIAELIASRTPGNGVTLGCQP